MNRDSRPENGCSSLARAASATICLAVASLGFAGCSGRSACPTAPLLKSGAPVQLQSFDGDTASFCHAAATSGGTTILGGRVNGRLLWGEAIAKEEGESSALITVLDEHGRRSLLRRVGPKDALNVASLSANSRGDLLAAGPTQGNGWYVSRLRADGSTVWDALVAAFPTGEAVGSELALSETGNAIIGGQYQRYGVVLGAESLVGPSTQEGGHFMTCLDPAGHRKWVRFWPTCHVGEILVSGRSSVAFAAVPVCDGRKLPGTELHALGIGDGTDKVPPVIAQLRGERIAEGGGRLTLSGTAPSEGGGVASIISVQAFSRELRHLWTREVHVTGYSQVMDMVSTENGHSYVLLVFRGVAVSGGTRLDSMLAEWDLGGVATALIEFNEAGTILRSKRVAVFGREAALGAGRDGLMIAAEAVGPNELTGTDVDLSRIRVAPGDHTCPSLDPTVWDCFDSATSVSRPVDRTTCVLVRVPY